MSLRCNVTALRHLTPAVLRFKIAARYLGFKLTSFDLVLVRGIVLSAVCYIQASNRSYAS